MFRRLLKYRSEPDPSMDPMNTHALNARIPISAQRKLTALNDSTNKLGVFRLSFNTHDQDIKESQVENR